MTVGEVLTLTDRRNPNLYSQEEKLHWLSEAEGMVWNAMELFSGTEGSYPGLTEKDFPDRELLLPESFTGLYELWLEGAMHYADQDYLLYNNAIARFNARWKEFFAWCCRTIPQPARSIRYL